MGRVDSPGASCEGSLASRRRGRADRADGPAHGSTGRVWRARDQFRAAEPLYHRALAIDEQSYGPDHPDVAAHLNNLALLQRATNRLDEAEPLARRGLRILIEFRHRTGHEHPNFDAGLANYRDLLEALGKTPYQIERQLHELVEPLRSEGS
jgi:hypothetical protein